MPEPWLKLDTSVTSNPKVMALSGDTFKAWVCLLCETKLYAHDDLVPPLPRLAFALHVNMDRLREHITTLVEARLLDQDGDGYHVHDWEDWQRVPSDTKDARAERQRRSRFARRHPDTEGLDNNVTTVTPITGDSVTVTVGNNSHGSHESHAGHGPRLDKTRLEETRLDTGESIPLTPSTRAVTPRGTRIPANFPLTDALIAHAAGLGIDDLDLLEGWRQNYHDYWSQRTEKATSLNWEKHAKIRMGADVRSGRLAPRGIRNGPPSRAQEPISTGVPELTPAEETYKEFLGVLSGDAEPGEAGEATTAVAATLGGWDALMLREKPPRFSEWVGAWHRSQGAFPSVDPLHVTARTVHGKGSTDA